MNEHIYREMLEAFGRGLMASRGLSRVETSESKGMLAYERKRKVMQMVSSLEHDQRLQLLMAVAQIAGIDAIGEQSNGNGCFVDLTTWEDKKVMKLIDVIEFITS